ncbi:tumor necrosis factor receptor superfamily member 5-like isoform X1 [Seriola lalandi dorsalis]|uniref:tumor necrosis factor receptor superfamily member 5-like isoform X1 n=1 Tax=Seriola lalandi dorsalis TaxID=1841481 RepID=UPI000C6F91A9|nr:tumor necrosis factor receptor superfamily member 5-like isoform X1 [Seriola lalandi dorsalis]
MCCRGIKLSTLLVFAGYVAVFTVPGLCCRAEEYTTRDGQCCPMCHQGAVVQRDCTLQSGTRCSLCNNGTFMNQPNGLNKCFPCTSCVPAQGLFAQQKCTVTTDTVCDVLSGYFCTSLANDTGCSLAEKHTHCAPGQRIKEPGTSRTDTVCEDCQPGYFSQDGVNCTAWTICSETWVKVKEGGSSNNVVCGAASRNHSFLFTPLLLCLSETLVRLVTRDWYFLCHPT